MILKCTNPNWPFPTASPSSLDASVKHDACAGFCPWLSFLSQLHIFIQKKAQLLDSWAFGGPWSVVSWIVWEVLDFNWREGSPLARLAIGSEHVNHNIPQRWRPSIPIPKSNNITYFWVTSGIPMFRTTVSREPDPNCWAFRVKKLKHVFSQFWMFQVAKGPSVWQSELTVLSLAFASSMASCLLFIFDAFHARSCCNLSHSLPTAGFAAFFFMTSLIGPEVCSKIVMMPWIKSSICNVIFMRPISPFVKNTPLGLERFHVPLLFCQIEIPFARCRGSPPAYFWHCNFLRRCLGGGDAYSCNAWQCWSHWHLQLLSGVPISGVKFFNFVGRNIVSVPLLKCSLNCGFFNVPLLLCFLLSTFGHRWPHFWPNRFWSRRDLCFGQSTIHQWMDPGWTLVQDSESRGPDPTFRENITSTIVPYIIVTALFQIVQIGFCLPHDVKKFWRNWEQWLFRYKQLSYAHDVVAINKLPGHTPEIFRCFHSVASSEKSAALQRITPRLAQSGGYSHRIESLDSLVP